MAQAQLPQLFGVIPTGQPCITTPSSAPSTTSFLFTLPATKPFSHICVFLLPGITLPPNTAAAVYISLPASPSQSPQQAQFKFLGGIGPGKESAIFKISGLSASNAEGVQNGEIDMDAPEDSPGGGGDITLGISLESADSVASQMAALHSSTANPTSPSQALVPVNRGGQGGSKVDTVVLAQRIIKNAFNFLASFSGNVGGTGVEVVPLKAFEEWWRKFEGRVRSDPEFLERDGD
ncbi:uncharacterized protein K444DRAFT_661581 [Hyaloscypha bicolor E]|uniref:Uncharacterized protein n=1 Tax=Hyaloscypha bicolor E TaxID=1095630 RepID=A0A2J6TH92_9HELO|nr:uncharacterized protein K444DRAFT_661581 [Hyaloscypha bicolor E]PMD62406.1 hypothetical protein K444DRAFT_661581 [Hyaloscypha bicolor E]